MELSVWLNSEAHGHIHELLGGTWSKQATAFAANISDITQLFAHNSTVSRVAPSHIIHRKYIATVIGSVHFVPYIPIVV